MPKVGAWEWDDGGGGGDVDAKGGGTGIVCLRMCAVEVLCGGRQAWKGVAGAYQGNECTSGQLVCE